MIEKKNINLSVLPGKPGVYQFYSKENELLYIGKAKHLRKRVSSYFQKEHDSGRLRVLVKKIDTVQCLVVDTEYDALLLEHNLIKTHQPRYNIRLKDDKTYPWICIKKEAFSRVFLTRKYIKDGSEYFGPYASVRTARLVLDLIKEIYPLRSCHLDLSEEKIKLHKYKVCLEYHIGNCKGPCQEKQSAQDYNNDLINIRNILKGNLSEVLQHMKQHMKTLAESLAFEQAQSVKEQMVLLTNYQEKSTVVNPNIQNVDVFSIVSDAQKAYVNYLKVHQGRVIQSYTVEIKKQLEENQEEILEMSLIEIRSKMRSQNREIFLPFPLQMEIPNVKCTVPKAGDKRRLVELSVQHANQYRKDMLNKIEITNPQAHTQRLMAQMQKDLRLPSLPLHIECFDNSNLQGTNPVAACVVFKDGKPSKKDYRHFRIKTVEGPDDFASMQEVVFRRYKHLLDENLSLPQLIVIDGGKGQLGAALKALKQLGIKDKIATLGIAKRLEEIFFPDDPIPLYLEKTSETLKVIQHLRNEAHRFGLSHHRNIRSKKALTSELDRLKGIGPKTITLLLQRFKSLSNIKEASPKELENAVGKAKTQLIMDAFSQMN